MFKVKTSRRYVWNFVPPNRGLHYAALFNAFNFMVASATRYVLRFTITSEDYKHEHTVLLGFETAEANKSGFSKQDVIEAERA